MAWIRLDDQIAHHPKFLRSGPVCSWFFVCSLGYCQKFLTDGLIPEEALSTVSNVTHPKRCAETLVRSGLFERDDKGFRIHDYLDYNESAAVVKERRRLDRVRKESGRNPAGIQPDSARIPAARARASHPIPSLMKKNKEKPAKNGEGPIFKGRFIVMPFMEGHLVRILGTDTEAFDLHKWYFDLDARLATNGIVDTTWPWLEKQLFREARTRGLMLGSADEIAARTVTATPQTPAEKIAADFEEKERRRSRVRFR